MPRCRFCGGPTEFVRFAHKPKPRVWFKCARPTQHCSEEKTDKATNQTKLVRREQSLSLNGTDPRYILPLWRNTAAYQALREVGISMERTHHLSRVRHRVGAKGPLNRPKRIGRDLQQLRANASIITDWLQILLRQGWLPQTILRGEDPFTAAPWDDGDPPLPRARATGAHIWKGREIHSTEHGEEFIYADPRNHEQPYLLDGQEFVSRMTAERQREGLELPYGKAAVKLDLGPLRPAALTKRHIDLDPDRAADTPPAAQVVDLETGEILSASGTQPGSSVVPIEDARRLAAQHDKDPPRSGSPPAPAGGH